MFLAVAKGDISISNSMRALRQCSVLGAAMDAIGVFVSIGMEFFQESGHVAAAECNRLSSR
jgi:hypothetical protein